MANIAGKLTGVYVDAFDLSGFFKHAASDLVVGMDDTTVFGNTYVSRLATEVDGHLALDGFWDGTATSGIDARADAQLNGAQIVATLVLGSATVGTAGRARLYMLRESAYKTEAAKGAAIKCSLNGDNDGQVAPGYLLHALGAETSLAPLNGTAVSFAVPTGTATTISSYVQNLHVTALSGSSPNITIKTQYSTDGSTGWTDLTSFTAFTTTTAEQKTGTASAVGSPGAYIRFVATLNSGSLTSVTFLVAFARKS